MVILTNIDELASAYLGWWTARLQQQTGFPSEFALEIIEDNPKPYMYWAAYRVIKVLKL